MFIHLVGHGECKWSGKLLVFLSAAGSRHKGIPVQLLSTSSFQVSEVQGPIRRDVEGLQKAGGECRKKEIFMEKIRPSFKAQLVSFHLVERLWLWFLTEPDFFFHFTISFGVRTYSHIFSTHRFFFHLRGVVIRQCSRLWTWRLLGRWFESKWSNAI